MSFQKIRSTIAVAALAAGVSWLSAGTSVANNCAETAVLSPASVVSACDNPSSLRVEDSGSAGSRMIASESTKVAMAAGEMARHFGFTGVATGKEVLSMADLSGVGATWGLSSLFSASPALFPMVPGPAGVADLATMADLPPLPPLSALPEVPGTPLDSRLPGQMTIGQGPFPNRVVGTGVDSPLGLQEPVSQVSAELVGQVLPKAVDSLEGVAILPGGGSGAAGLADAVGGLGLK
ncbi:hypothetical protein [Nonomuraea gerenzanensis]|uniref:Uncharacterized protein n=1 Tax=Nonomuraea gerenzanensis TaxID=93944 RepID=A0A1M4DY81_9ACTN|nr:hypothetical protein [Nonomuraea gerenzanensis]UBU13846.1 hypothetical protein LCN96_02070 [Nonomuraea gerenzanensis]SBO91523.1 hypothetical protein BN4615_P1037 [Nonomuraea gerenzanensis]